MGKFKKNIEEALEQFTREAEYGDDIHYFDAIEIIAVSDSCFDAVDNSYKFGYISARRKADTDRRMVPVYDIPQMSDEHWNELAARR